jgi:very-short-patch-repair endonuclease
MDPATSLYELGGMMFPGKAILLREHFRCVEPIIRFSSRFYDDMLVPMRLPTATERLDPPLVDILVRNGEKKGDLNRREAEVVVEEIRHLTEDPAFACRTIGVISLIGDKQAKLIHDRLLRELGAEVVERHRIMCGNAATFQGQERDIVFLSMVACPKSATAQRMRMFEQRFNVALSRARDRLVLVRSVTASDLKPGDLKLKVVEHFRNPMGESKVAARKDVLDACESGFERDFGARLVDLGYRLRAQVPVGGFRIDFVVEGANDARLAIELDGDKYHGPGRWAEDFRRQNALERLGWTFWRCWGSSWEADRGGCLADLCRALAAMGIEPLGAEPLQGTWTEFREVGGEAPRFEGPGAEEPSAASMALAEAPLHSVSAALDAALAAAARIAGDGGAARPNGKAAAVDGAAAANGANHRAANGGDAGHDAEDGLVAEVGDVVVVRFHDEPSRAVRVRLSRTENKPDSGILHVGEPLAKALLGCGMEEEIEVDLGARTRTAVIELIERRSSVVA